MEAKELRIGNLLQGEPIQNVNQGIYSDGVVEITAHGIFKIEHGNLNYTPIPLTEEWLLKLGFKVCSWNRWGVITGYDKQYIDDSDNHSIFVYIEDKKLYFVLSGEGWKKEQKYVHQLQNLYFALTGEELTIKNE